jgi:hypothetical protein
LSKALAIDAVGDAAEDVFDLAYAGVGVKLVERAATAESAIGSLEPSSGFVSAAEGLSGIGVDLGEADSAIGLSRGEARLLGSATGEGARGNADLFGDLSLAQVEPLGQKEERLDRETFADKVGECAVAVHGPAEDEFSAE